MAININTGASQTIDLLPGQTLTVSASPNAEGSLVENIPDPSGNGTSDPQRRAQGRTVPIGPVAFRRTFGPYDSGASLTISCKANGPIVVDTPSGTVARQTSDQASGGATFAVATAGSRGASPLPFEAFEKYRMAQLAGQARVVGRPSYWWDFSERGASVVRDRISAVPLTLTGTGNPWQLASGLQVPGIVAKAGTRWQASPAGVNISTKHLARDLSLATLKTDEQINVFFVLRHPVYDTANTQTVFFAGTLGNTGSTKGGWGIAFSPATESASHANMRLRFIHRGQNGTSPDQQDLSTNGMAGADTIWGNTASVVSVQISRIDATNLDIYASRMPLSQVAQTDEFMQFHYSVPDRGVSGSTAPFDYDESFPMVIGCTPKNGYSDGNMQDYLLPENSLACLGIQRGPLDLNRHALICRDLAELAGGMAFPARARL